MSGPRPPRDPPNGEPGAAGLRDRVRGSLPRRGSHRLVQRGRVMGLKPVPNSGSHSRAVQKSTREEALVGERTGREKGKCPWPRRGLPAPARTLAAPPAGAQNSHLDGCGVHVTSSAAGTSSGLLWAPQAFLVLQRHTMVSFVYAGASATCVQQNLLFNDYFHNSSLSSHIFSQWPGRSRPRWDTWQIWPLSCVHFQHWHKLPFLRLWKRLLMRPPPGFSQGRLSCSAG